MWLTFRSGGEEGETVHATGERFVIGRGEDADLVVHDDRVSRQHAYLRVYPDGRAELHDMGSANGTFVNGHKLTGPVLLQGNEQVQVGETVLTTSLDRPAAGETQIGVVPVEVGAAGGPSQSTMERIRLRRSTRLATLVGAGALAVAIAVVVLFVTGVFGGNGDEQPSIPEIIDAARPSTVVINALVDGEPQGSGTGWVYDADQGLIVTNQHVVNAGTSFTVGVLTPGQDETTEREATVVAAAPCDDLAVLKVSDTSNLKTLELGSQRDLRQGQTVVVVGFPGTASDRARLTATTGVVSIVNTSFDQRALDVPQYPNVIQTDAAINPGNSGGPMLDLDERLVGVNSAGITLQGGRIIQGQGYAIGVDRVKEVVPGLAQGNSVGWTGMGFVYPTESQELVQAGFPEGSSGLLVPHVVAGSPAANAGFGQGPVLITAVNGTMMDGSLPSYCDAIRNVPSGQPATFTVLQPNSTTTQEVQVPLD